MDTILQQPGMRHIWYYIPLCTIFPEKSNGETFKTQFSHLKSHNLPISLFLKGRLILLKLVIHGGIHKTILGYQSSDPSGVGLSFKQYSPNGILAQDSSRTVSRGFYLSKPFVKASSSLALLQQLNWSIQSVFRKPVWYWPFWAN
ncbi:hypothetical protein O181_027593 [Austropuccinia psidii MF-1]|uniref:Uncharacterized protein n=1 Tax=Austropuccinia psidii MF-1 TaxID=1389203 RepID=A0A9Q3CPV7_9BASI|nr:hypothetical protein [Austropuccinia psidii MF-1]